MEFLELETSAHPVERYMTEQTKPTFGVRSFPSSSSTLSLKLPYM